MTAPTTLDAANDALAQGAQNNSPNNNKNERPVLTVSQMIDRANREVRMRRWCDRIDVVLHRSVVAAIYAGTAYCILMILTGNWF